MIINKNTDDSNSIVFDCPGALDFTEQVNIELSLTDKDGFTEVLPLELMWNINEIKHIQNILYRYFYKIVKRIPHISDRNKDIPEERRFTKVYYKCYNKFHHSHWTYDKYEYNDLSLKEAIEYIKKKNFSVVIP